MNNPETTDEIKARAREWHTRMNSGDVDKATALAFEGWLHADPAHKQAYHKLEQMWRDLDFVAMEAGVDTRSATTTETRPSMVAWLPNLINRPAIISAGLAAAAAAFAVVVFMRSSIDTQTEPAEIVAIPQHETQIAEIREIRLDDGSVVTLGAKSQIDTSFSEDSRTVKLISGEAFFDVAEDPMRPFYVAVDDTLIRVVGTKFDVKRTGSDVHVAVLEGIVDVIKADDIPAELSLTAPPSSDAKRLTAGQRIVASLAPTLPAIETVETVVPGGWREGRLAYEDASLREIVADVNRYSERSISISGDKAAELRFTLAFRPSEIDMWLQVLEDTQPVEIVEASNGDVIVRSRGN